MGERLQTMEGRMTSIEAILRARPANEDCQERASRATKGSSSSEEEEPEAVDDGADGNADEDADEAAGDEWGLPLQRLTWEMLKTNLRVLRFSAMYMVRCAISIRSRVSTKTK
ncbi:hypothetical protein PHYSODRAFT_321283 [Phytophthora sojae]|uniref:Uncharacterized protein n=1 Tax=Phytophthora sojae (strain P6497) TaxID=1094619 RepID=G4YI99_PHYSP|nr:hypothetical protein PHYSODRAFT_321283 [Phytophthora sojae]EGZ27482.1 hypothetical protein PHYSODRAFT_321283 [Phytophthora sojae]|eukprot:XP_009514757.1 hypothetical protein PHYSODRAFT_321283 [Phytophthora sojae]